MTASGNDFVITVSEREIQRYSFPNQYLSKCNKPINKLGVKYCFIVN